MQTSRVVVFVLGGITQMEVRLPRLAARAFTGLCGTACSSTQRRSCHPPPQWVVSVSSPRPSPTHLVYRVLVLRSMR
jgi:hypothetical protein